MAFRGCLEARERPAEAGTGGQCSPLPDTLNVCQERDLNVPSTMFKGYRLSTYYAPGEESGFRMDETNMSPARVDAK